MSDTSPLITLAVADELAVLVIPRIPIEIPDAVYTEATHIRTAPEANRVAAWINLNSNLVPIVPTEIGIDQQRRLAEQRTIRGMGEQAAIETLNIFFEQHPGDEAL